MASSGFSGTAHHQQPTRSAPTIGIIALKLVGISLLTIAGALLLTL